MGIGAVSPRTGLRLLGTLLGRGETQVGVARVDWGKLFQADPAAALSPLLSEQARDAAPTPAQAEEPELLKTLRALPEAERREELAAFLSSLLAETLKLKSREPLTPRQGLFELGLDSILALQLKAKLELNLGRPFPATLFFTHPTVESLVEYLSGELKPPADAAGPPPAASETPEAVAQVTGEAPSTDSLTDEEIARLIAQEIGYGQLNPRT
jgi:myxalamid-type polyketide synthase MxaB